MDTARDRLLPTPSPALVAVEIGRAWRFVGEQGPTRAAALRPDIGEAPPPQSPARSFGLALVRALPVASLAAFSACASVAPPPAEHEEESDIRQLNFTVGRLALEQDAWKPLDELISFGIDFTEDWNSGILFLEGGLHFSRDRATIDDTGTTPLRAEIDLFELSAGLLLEWPRDHYLLRPYVGAGGSVLFVDADILEDELSSADDGTFGVYWKAGVLLRVLQDSHVGIEVRTLDADSVSTELADADLDSTRIALVFGASF